MGQTEDLEYCTGKSNFGRPFESVCGSIQFHHKPGKDCSKEDRASKFEIRSSAKIEALEQIGTSMILFSFLKCFTSKDRTVI